MPKLKKTCDPYGRPCTCTNAGKIICSATKYDMHPVEDPQKPSTRVEVLTSKATDKELEVISPTGGVTNALTEDDKERGEFPMFDGLLAYFPNALAEVSRVSKIGNDQHNPGQPMHWARGKSTDHENKIARHLLDSGGVDARGVRHSARLAWRALALLQEELERETGCPMSRASK